MPLLRPRVIRQEKPGTGRILVATTSEDSLLSAIVKWIPVEVLTVYKTIDGFIAADYQPFRLWFTVGVIIICPLWIGFATKPDLKQIAWRQVILAPIAFTCWAVAMQTEIMKEIFFGWLPWMGSVVLGVGTLLLPIFDGMLKALGINQSQ
jgi:hypothetical protein